MSTQIISSVLTAISADQALSERLREGDREALKKMNLSFENIYAQAHEEDDETQLNAFLCGISAGCALSVATRPADEDEME